ncbi:MAG: o-succinylbenzoate synthase [bacterium]
MKIKSAEILKLVIPLKSPFITSFGKLTDRSIVFVKLYDSSGVIGLGESANMDFPIYEPDFNTATIALLRELISSQLIGKEVNTIENLENCYKNIRGNNIAKTAIESAYWNIESIVKEVPLNVLWGGVKDKVNVGISIGLGNSLEESIDKVKKYVSDNNPKRVKLKIRRGIDLKYIESIRNYYPKLNIQIDANAGYTIKDKSLFKRLDMLNLSMIEQPFEYNDLVDHSILQSELNTPICLDESISNYHMADQAIKIKACKIMNLKPQRVGGYYEAKRIAKLCELNSIPVWCGGMIESGWGQLFNTAIATLPNFNYDNDICLSKWYLFDDILKNDIKEKDGVIDIKSTYDLFEIDEKKFQKYTVYRENIS